MDIVGKRGWFFLISVFIIIPGIISMIVPGGLRGGIEFTSGSALTITFEHDFTESDIRAQMQALGHPEAVIQKLGGNAVFIRTLPLKEAVVDGVGNIITPSERTQIEGALTANVAPIVGREYEAISPTVAKETVRNAAIAVAIAAVGILLYITWAFRKVPNAFRYGICSVLALGHDMLAVVGIYSILSRVLNMEVNSMFIVGVLTLLGYTINDSIVVFDRIRENIALSPDRPLRQTVNDSLWQTMGRSLNTGTGVLVVLLALLFLGGPTIRPLVVVFIIGMVAGTYSSIFNSSLLLVSWESGDFGKAMRFLRLSRPKPARQTAR